MSGLVERRICFENSNHFIAADHLLSATFTVLTSLLTLRLWALDTRERVLASLVSQACLVASSAWPATNMLHEPGHLAARVLQTLEVTGLQDRRVLFLLSVCHSFLPGDYLRLIVYIMCLFGCQCFF